MAGKKIIQKNDKHPNSSNVMYMCVCVWFAHSVY